MQPERITLRNDGRHMLVHWPDGRMDSLDAASLWAECPSSLGRRRRMQTDAPDAPEGIRILAVSPVGLYGVNIAFSDGHDRGIFPWPFLEKLGGSFVRDASGAGREHS